jgi:O-antigen ligase
MNANLAVLVIALGLVMWRYSRGFEQGLTWTVFLLVVLPGSVGLEMGGALPSLTFHRIALLITLLRWSGEKGIPRADIRVPFGRVLVFSAACFLISTCISSFPLVSFKQFTYYVFEFVLFFFVVQTSSVQRALTEKMVTALGCGLATVAFLAFAERYLNIKISSILPYAGSDYGVSRFGWGSLDEGAITVSYRHRILFGIACAIGTLKYLVDSAFANNKKTARRKLFLAFVCGAALYFSMSRGPWLAFILGCAILIGVRPGRFIRPALTLAVIATMFIIIRPGIWTSIMGLSQSTLDESSVRGSSFRWRQQVFSLAVTKIAESGPVHFLFGYGGGSTIMTDFGRIETSAGDLLPMESWDCEIAIILYERGVVGFLLSIALFGGALVGAMKRLRKIRSSPDPLPTFLCAALAVFCFMMTNVAIYAIQLIYIQAMVLGLTSRLLSQPPDTSLPDGEATYDMDEVLNGTK